MNNSSPYVHFLLHNLTQYIITDKVINIIKLQKKLKIIMNTCVLLKVTTVLLQFEHLSRM